MIETAAVFDLKGNVIHWHLPLGRSGGWLPDSRDLWTILWNNRENLGGVAHTHTSLEWGALAIWNRCNNICSM